MSTSVQNFTALLQASRKSVTKQRLAVFGALMGHEPMSMGQLAGKVRGADRASVYRAVELFERLGIVQRLNTGWKYKLELTDKFAQHHHHLTCLNCGRTIAMNEHELEQLIDKLATTHSFRSTAHQIEIQGLCRDCQQLS